MKNIAIKTFAKELDNFEAAGLLKEEAQMKNMSAAEIKIYNSKKKFLNFTSYDFLGFNQDERISKVAHETAEKFGFSFYSNRGLTGTSELHKLLEYRISNFYEKDDCLLFSSHYLNFSGILDCLLKENDILFLDSLSQASMIDGARISLAKKYLYQNNDVDDLEYYLKMSGKARFRFLAFDSIFHTDGTHANVPKIVELSRKYKCFSILDDSLGLGFMGSHGFGAIEYHELKNKPDVITGSFNSLGGVSGSFLTGPSDIIGWLRQACRTYTLAEPMSAISAAIADKSFELIESQKTRLDDLRSNIKYIHERLVEEDWEIIDNFHPIISIIIGDVVTTQKMIDELFSRGIVVSGLCYPNVPQETARIKIQISAAHTHDNLEEFISILNKARNKHFKKSED